FPLKGERGRRGRLAGAAVPVTGIGGIAFLAMQIGMHPGARLVVLLLGAMVRRVPIALGVPPQPLRREPDIGRRLRLRQRLPEAVEVHGGHTACCGQLPSLARCSGNGAIDASRQWGVGQKARGAAGAAPLNSVAQPHFLRLSAASSACSLTSCAASLTWPLTLSALPSASVCLSPIAAALMRWGSSGWGTTQILSSQPSTARVAPRRKRCCTLSVLAVHSTTVDSASRSSPKVADAEKVARVSSSGKPFNPWSR